MTDISLLLAKDQHKEISLFDHSKMVLNLGMCLSSKLIGSLMEQINNEVIDKDELNSDYNDEFQRGLSICLGCHDIGKSVNRYQSLFLSNKKVFDDEHFEYKHNVLSWAFLSRKIKGFYRDFYCPLRTAVLLHHTVNESTKNIENENVLDNLDNEEIICMSLFYEHMKKYITDVHGIVFDDDYDYQDNDTNKKVSDDKLYGIKFNLNRLNYDSKNMNNKQLLYNAILVRADRMVSSERYDNSRILDNDIEYMESLINSFDVCHTIEDVDINECGYEDIERLGLQKRIVNEMLTKSNHNVVGASAGFGKTLTGLMWFLKEKKKMIWVAPRNVIVNSTYESVVDELVKLKQPNVKVACYQGGMFTKCNYECNLDDLDSFENMSEIDIIVTNIDSFLNRNIKNNMRIHLYSLYSSNVIFDEYHEFFVSEPLFPAFLRIMVARVYNTNSKTLLLSATPLSLDLVIGKNDKKVMYHKTDEIPIHNGDMKVTLNVHKVNDISDIVIPPNDCFVITNTVGQAQSLYHKCVNDDKTLIHALYTDERRNEIENELYDRHGKKSVVSERNTVIGTNIIGVGLNISAVNISELVSTPENTIQRVCGRGGRFNEKEYNGKIEYDVYLLDDKSNETFIKRTYDIDLYKNWFDKLSELDGKTVTKNDLYHIYEEFKDEHKNVLEKYYKSCFDEGSKMLDSLDVVSTSKNKKKLGFNTNTTKNGYRGNAESLFAIARYNDGKWCKPLNININHLKHETNEHIEERQSIVSKNNIEGINYPAKEVLKFVYNIKSKGDYTIEKLSKMANRSDRPIPLFDFGYDDNIGLFKK